MATETEKAYRKMRTTAYCRMSSLSQRMSDRLRPATYRTEPGSPERVALAEARGSMNDLRAALVIAADHGDTARVDRNGFRQRT